MALYANLKLYDSDNFEPIYHVKEVKAEKAIIEAIRIIRIKATKKFFSGFVEGLAISFGFKK